MRLIALALVTAAIATAMPASGQAFTPIEPIMAKQCAMWAAVQSTDAESRGDAEGARTYEGVSQYFVGLYEGLARRGIADQRESAALLEVERDLARFDAPCLELMQNYGLRMGAWGEQLSTLGNAPAGSKK